MNTDQLSMLEVAIELMKQKKTPQPIATLLREVLELKGLDDPDGFLAAQLYIDITTSSDFVFTGDGEWDLKIRQSLDVFDRDGSHYSTGSGNDTPEVEIDDIIEEEDDNEYGDYGDEYIDEIDEDNEDDEDEDDDSSRDYDDYDPNEDDDRPDYLDEAIYNELMDDYEDMYDDH